MIASRGLRGVGVLRADMVRHVLSAVSMRAICAMLGVVLANGGCVDRADPHITQIQQLEDKLATQGRSLAEKNSVIQAQASEIQQLRKLDDRAKYDSLVRVDRITIERLSGFYDDNSDGTPDGIVLYLKLFDAAGDVLKAAGSARVALFDLSQPEGQQSLAKVDFTPEQMKDLWFGRFMTSHYTLRLPFDTVSKRPVGSTVTALVHFTDLLSGKVFEIQQPLQQGAAGKAAGS